MRVESEDGRLRLWFKGRPGGIPAGDDETRALLPSTLRGTGTVLLFGAATIVLYVAASVAFVYLLFKAG